MKKLAIAAVLSSMAVVATAQTSTTIYGVVDVGVARNIGQGVTSMDSGLQSGSRIGFRGQEELGNGVSAVFALEAGFNADNGAHAEGGKLFNRQAWVGLSSTTMGTLKLGHQITPIWSALDSVDPFASGMGGNATNMFNDGGKRMSNTINYSHSLGPVAGQVAYGFGEVPGSVNDGRTIGAAVKGTFGPVYTTVAYHSTDTGSDQARTFLVGGTVDVTSGLKAHGAVADNKGLNNHDTRDYMLGVSAKATDVDTFLGSVIRKQDRSVANNDATQYAVGWTHHLSPRTNLYTSYAHINYDAQPKDRLVMVGIRHKF